VIVEGTKANKEVMAIQMQKMVEVNKELERSNQNCSHSKWPTNVNLKRLKIV
jgi:hypothetical protein